MKQSVIILSTYLFALSLFPCGDVCGGIVELWQEWFDIEHIEHPDHDQHSNTCDDDPCTPLCGCSCCSITLDYPLELFITLGLPVAPPTLEPSFNPDNSGILSVYDIWQPPKFS